MSGDKLGLRALNRTTLARQLLLQRGEMPILDAVEHLVGLQAQEPLNPYTALWSRLDAFDPEDLAGLLVDRKVVRIVVHARHHPPRPTSPPGYVSPACGR